MLQIIRSDGGIPCSSAGTVPVVDQQTEYFTSLSSASQNYGDTQRSSCSKTVKKTPVPSERSQAGNVSSSPKLSRRTRPYRAGGQSIKDAQFGESDQESSGAGTYIVWNCWQSSWLSDSSCCSWWVIMVLIRTDNMTVVSNLNRQGGLRSRPLYRLARGIVLWPQAKFL